MSKRKRSLLLQRGVMVFSALATAAAVAPLLAGVIEGGGAAAGAAAAATTTEEEAVSVTTAAESGLKKRSSEALGKAAEGGGKGGFLKKGSQEWNEAFRQKYRRGITGYKLQHSERFHSLHNALWKKSYESGLVSRAEMVSEVGVMNRFLDREILNFRVFQSLEKEEEYLEKARLVEQDFQRQKINLEWLPTESPTAEGSSELQKLPIPTTTLAKAGGGGGGGGGGGSAMTPARTATAIPAPPRGTLSPAEYQTLVWQALTQEQKEQLVREIEPFRTMSRSDVLSAMPDDLKKLHSDLVKLHPELHDIPLMYRTDLEFSYYERLGTMHKKTIANYRHSQRYIKLNKSNIEATGLSVRSIAWHEAMHAAEALEGV